MAAEAGARRRGVGRSSCVGVTAVTRATAMDAETATLALVVRRARRAEHGARRGSVGRAAVGRSWRSRAPARLVRIAMAFTPAPIEARRVAAPRIAEVVIANGPAATDDVIAVARGTRISIIAARDEAD